MGIKLQTDSWARSLRPLWILPLSGLDDPRARASPNPQPPPKPQTLAACRQRPLAAESKIGRKVLPAQLCVYNYDQRLQQFGCCPNCKFFHRHTDDVTGRRWWGWNQWAIRPRRPPSRRWKTAPWGSSSLGAPSPRRRGQLRTAKGHSAL